MDMVLSYVVVFKVNVVLDEYCVCADVVDHI